FADFPRGFAPPRCRGIAGYRWRSPANPSALMIDCDEKPIAARSSSYRVDEFGMNFEPLVVRRAMDEVAFEENNAPWAEVTEQSAVTVVKRGPRTQSYYKVVADRRKVRIRHRRVPRGLNIGVFFVVAPSPILHLFLSVCKA